MAGSDLSRAQNGTEYFRTFRERAAASRIPLSGSLDLTHQCNLRCVHCYLARCNEENRPERNELMTSKVLSILDEITEEGCLYLLLTGGEPLLRKDFPEVFRHAKKNGLLVTVFTNGTMIRNNIIELFQEFPPYQVEISLYGATAETYEKITGVSGSFRNCIDGIETLVTNGIPVKLKTVLMTHNHQEFHAIEQIAKDYGVGFRFDASLFPRLNGDRIPLSLRVSSENVIEKEFSDPSRLKQWIELYENFKSIPDSDDLYNCGAGLTNFHIDPYGNLQPCLMVPRLKYDLMSGAFSTGWKNAISRLREERASPDYLCNSCDKRILCGFCPAFFELETGSETARSEYLCEMGNYRFQKICNRL